MIWREVMWFPSTSEINGMIVISEEDWSETGLDLNLKIKILEYHGNLRGDDFLAWRETIKQIFKYKDVSRWAQVVITQPQTWSVSKHPVPQLKENNVLIRK